MANKKWTVVYDDAGTFKEYLQIGEKKFIFVEVLDLREYMSARELEDRTKFAGEVDYIDLAAIPEKEIASAKKSCDFDSWGVDANNFAALAQCCVEYGLKAPVFSESSNNRRAVHRACRRAAGEYAEDSSALEDALEKPVNAIGSTAAEFMAGDLTSAIVRGCESGEKNAQLVARAYGVDQETIDAAKEKP